MNWILIIAEKTELALAAELCLAKELPFKFVCVYNLQDAREALFEYSKRSCELIVSSLAAPADADAPVPVPVGWRSTTAIDFLKEVRGKNSEPPCIFIDAAPSADDFERLADIGNVKLMAVADMRQHLASHARTLVVHEPPRSAEQSHLMDVDIAFSGNICNWRLSGKNGVGISEAGSIKVENDYLERLLTDSELVGMTRSDAQDLTRKLLLRLGRDLYRCFATNLDRKSLWEAVSHHTDRMRMLERTRFRFEVDNVTSRLLVEALAREDADAPNNEDYWMLRTPIVRRYGSHAGRSPLFKDRHSRNEPVQCLIILGNPKKFDAAGALGKEYPAILKAVEEINWLEKYLSTDHKAFGLEVPVVLRYSKYAEGDFGRVVRETLRKGAWQLIHYSGHSDIGNDGSGYLVLGDHQDDQIEIEEFARSAAHAQFIFLNSCRSANVRFVQRSVERSVPAVAGYAWPIRDDIAAAFSREFYTNLFGERGKLSRRFLEYAFMQARKYLHTTYKDTTVWSSPLLFMQSMTSESEPEPAPDSMAMRGRPS